jgi:hypothetical protein
MKTPSTAEFNAAYEEYKKQEKRELMLKIEPLIIISVIIAINLVAGLILVNF